jgi:serine/threonine protein kinase
MSRLEDRTIEHLRGVLDWPDTTGTRYRIVETIGRGGMGAVYLAQDTELDRPVALKVLRDPDFDADAAERMLTEARVIARLEHPGIIPVHDLGKLADGRTYYAMKLVRGKRLDAHFDVDAGVSDRLRVFERICETVAFAHSHGVIHRDLKPANVMVGEFGEVLVLDWGLAKLRNARGEPHGGSAEYRGAGPAGRPVQGPAATCTVPGQGAAAACNVPGRGAAATCTVPGRGAAATGNVPGRGAAATCNVPGRGAAATCTVPAQGPAATSTGLGRAPTAVDESDQRATVTHRTAEGAVLGTPAFMAPEQALGQIERIDERTDVFGLGAVLYYLLIGRAPLERQRALGGARAAASVGAPVIRPPRQVDRSIPRPLNAICMKALSPPRDARYVDADALRRDVMRFLDGRPVSAYRENVLERAGRVAWKYRTALLLVGAYLLMRILLILWTSAKGSGADA